MQVDIFELKYTFPIYIQGYVCDGSGRATKSDEFSEKVPKSFSIHKFILQILGTLNGSF